MNNNGRRMLLGVLIAAVTVWCFLMPLWELAVMSVTDADGNVTLTAMQSLLMEERTQRATWNTVLIAIVSTAMAMVIGLYLAWLVAYTNIRHKRWVTVLTLAPYVIPSYVIAIFHFDAIGFQAFVPCPSGAAAYNLGVILQQDSLGWSWYEGLKANRIKVEKGNGAVQKAVQSGEKAIGIVVDYLALRAKAAGAPVEFIYPQEGALVITEPIGIVAGTPHRQAAESFVDFILSKRGQEVTAQIGYTPIRRDVAPPAGYRSVDELQPMSADIGQMVRERTADKEQFARLFQS